MESIRPSFFLPGFPKAGTTTVDAILRTHPAIAMADPKEPDVFRAADLDAACRDAWRHRIDGQLVGDATVTYSFRHGVAQRIAAACDNPRFVFALREPIARTISHYEYRAQQGLEAHTFDQMVDRGWKSIAAGTGAYGTLLARWFSVFRRDQCLFVHQEHLAEDPQRVLDEVFEFLGVDSIPVSPVRENASRRGAAWSARLITTARPIASLAPTSMRTRLRPVAAWLYRRGRQAERRPLSLNTTRRLIDLFDPEVHLAEELTGLDLSAWRRRWDQLLEDAAS